MKGDMALFFLCLSHQKEAVVMMSDRYCQQESEGESNGTHACSAILGDSAGLIDRR